MSKSLGNFFTIRTVLEKYDAEVVRFFILRAHYRSPLNYSDVHLDDAKASLTRLYTALRNHVVSTHKIDWTHPQALRFKAAMDDDFNTPEAVAVLFDLANEVNKNSAPETVDLLFNLAGVMGLLQRNADAFLHGQVDTGLDVDALIAERLQAKKNKDFALADAIRKQLQEANIILEDTPQGTTWRSA